jgi:hypothetical protein
MKTFFRICLTLCALAFLGNLARAEQSSLFNRAGSRSLTKDEAVMFGPQAGKYRYDDRMIRAASIAQSRAMRHSTAMCWRYVKTALLAAGVVNTYPKSVFAKQAAQELPRDYGFKKIRCRDPFRAPLGSVLVYGGADAGHIEIRTSRGYCSDFISPTPYLKRPLLGIYVKPNA